MRHTRADTTDWGTAAALCRAYQFPPLQSAPLTLIFRSFLPGRFTMPAAHAGAVTWSRRPFFSQRRRLSLVAYKSAIDLASCWIVNADLLGGYQTDSLYVSIQKDIHQCQHVVFHLQQTSKWNKYMCHSQACYKPASWVFLGNSAIVCVFFSVGSIFLLINQ